jgi:hypothetical protein
VYGLRISRLAFAPGTDKKDPTAAGRVDYLKDRWGSIARAKNSPRGFSVEACAA